MTLKRQIDLLVFLTIALIFFVEYVLYYISLNSCNWQSIKSTNLDSFMEQDKDVNALKALLITDTHISSRHHWFDKLRREFQMQQAFQIAMFLHNPDVVIHLGDVTDAGSYQSDKQFEADVARFREIFSLKSSKKLFFVPGNHDIGIGYTNLNCLNPYTFDRFNRAFNSDVIKLWSHSGVSFVFVNSMAFESKMCDLYDYAQFQLDVINQKLKCLQDGYLFENCQSISGNPSVDNLLMKKLSKTTKRHSYSRPILIQHFPLYRQNELKCDDSLPDSMPSTSREMAFKPSVDCMSNSSSNQFLHSLRPRLVFDGHVHYACHRKLLVNGIPENISIEEYTLPPFSWRVSNHPAFILLNVNEENYAITKCYLPTEFAIFYSYLFGTVLILLIATRSKIHHKLILLKRHLTA